MTEHQRKIEVYAYLLLLGAVLILSFLVVRAYVNAVLLAAVAAIIFQPVYRGVLKAVKRRESIASLLTILIILLVIIGPLLLLGQQVFFESRDLYLTIESRSELNVPQEIEKLITEKLGAYVAVDSSVVARYAGDFLRSLSDEVGPFFSGLLQGLVKLFIGMFALYYFLKEGPRIKERLLDYTPLSRTHTQQIFTHLESTVHSIIEGSMIVALLQGFLIGIGFSMFGLPNPALWGAIGFVAALIPAIGTTLISVPVILYLLLINQIGAAIGFAVWGIFVVGLADNIARPLIMQRRSQTHPFLVLLSVIGGLGFFGPIGILWGPILLSLLMTTLEFYPVVLLAKEQ